MVQVVWISPCLRSLMSLSGWSFGSNILEYAQSGAAWSKCYGSAVPSFSLHRDTPSRSAPRWRNQHSKCHTFWCNVHLLCKVLGLNNILDHSDILWGSAGQRLGDPATRSWQVWRGRFPVSSLIGDRWLCAQCLSYGCDLRPSGAAVTSSVVAVRLADAGWSGERRRAWRECPLLLSRTGTLKVLDNQRNALLFIKIFDMAGNVWVLQSNKRVKLREPVCTYCLSVGILAMGTFASEIRLARQGFLVARFRTRKDWPGWCKLYRRYQELALLLYRTYQRSWPSIVNIIKAVHTLWGRAIELSFEFQYTYRQSTIPRVTATFASEELNERDVRISLLIFNFNTLNTEDRSAKTRKDKGWMWTLDYVVQTHAAGQQLSKLAACLEGSSWQAWTLCNPMGLIGRAD